MYIKGVVNTSENCCHWLPALYIYFSRWHLSLVWITTFFLRQRWNCMPVYKKKKKAKTTTCEWTWCFYCYVISLGIHGYKYTIVIILHLHDRRISCLWSTSSGVGSCVNSKPWTAEWCRFSFSQIHPWFYRNPWNQQTTGTERST